MIRFVPKGLADSVGEMDIKETITCWFTCHGVAGLILPDGWFGEPFDGQFTLTSISQAANEIEMTLGKNLTLQFAGSPSVREEGDDLVLGRFDELRFTWIGFGTVNDRHCDVYQEGEVKLMAPRG